MSKKIALITGASSGIGLEFAKVLAKNNCDLILVARNQDALEKLAEELKSKYQTNTYVLSVDLTQGDAIQKVSEFLNSEKLSVDYLINNAGIGDFGWFKDSDFEKNQRMMDLNMTSLVQLTHSIIPDMIQKKSGRIVNVASTASFQPGPYMAVYFATKAFVLSFSEAINNELSDHGISVTALCPGPTQSNFAAAAGNKDSQVFQSSKIPTSAQVAEYGYKTMMKGKSVAIHGAMNTFLVTIVRFVPRNLVVKIARWKMRSLAPKN